MKLSKNLIRRIVTELSSSIYVVGFSVENSKINKINGTPFISWRISQIYDQGVCIYFYFAFDCAGLKRPDIVYSAIEAKCRKAIMSNGGSLSHHHGIGKIRKRFRR